MTDRFKEGGLDNLLSGVKNFLPSNKSFPVIRLTEALLDPSSSSTQSLQETDEFLFLDPRAPRQFSPNIGNVPFAVGLGRSKRMIFQEAVVFMVGGVGYVEYGNMQEWAIRTGRKVTYGGTEILNPNEFVDVLQQLGGRDIVS